jgi:alpha-tubulin suppressor-like RCC1 family protein
MKDILRLARCRYNVWELLRGDAKHTPVFTWGDNVKGQAGAEGLKCCLQPHQALAERVFIAVSAGARHSAALTSAGDLYMWGHNSKGQLGIRRERVVVSVGISPLVLM